MNVTTYETILLTMTIMKIHWDEELLTRCITTTLGFGRRPIQIKVISNTWNGMQDLAFDFFRHQFDLHHREGVLPGSK